MKVYVPLSATILERYTERLGKSRWGDQAQKIECYADVIFTNYPTAKIIHMIRDPRDRIACKKVVRRRRNEEKKIRQFHSDISGWLLSVYLAEQNQKQYPDRYKIVDYETLCFQPKETMHDVCVFLVKLAFLLRFWRRVCGVFEMIVVRVNIKISLLHISVAFVS